MDREPTVNFMDELRGGRLRMPSVELKHPEWAKNVDA